MPSKPTFLYQSYHASNRYMLAVKYDSCETKILMRVLQGTVNTRDLPGTIDLLKKILPSVLQTICYNESNNPFHLEVQRTEIGHLFEHILIENLSLLKIAQGYDSVEYSGVTKWNWKLDPMGTFHITVSAGVEDATNFAIAMTKTIELINTVLDLGQRQNIISRHLPLSLR